MLKVVKIFLRYKFWGYKNKLLELRYSKLGEKILVDGKCTYLLYTLREGADKTLARTRKKILQLPNLGFIRHRAGSYREKKLII
jgi:hypothetical protein